MRIQHLGSTEPGAGQSLHETRGASTRYLTLGTEITTIDKQLDELVRSVNPTLLSLSGVGPVTAATLLVAAGDNPERLRAK